jgi:electron-transferring-flavoprotein dehydrogenase
MHNEGFYTASICELVRWLGERAEELGVNIFPGFPVDSLLVDGTSVRGVRTTPSGLDRTGQPQNDYDPPTELTARVTVLAEGTRGSLSQAWMEWQKVSSANPQIFALGVKEVWRLAQPLDRVIHTMGWPVPGDAFGGSFLYPLGQDQASLGLVVGLDYRQTSVDVHVLLQRLKMHPLFRPFLEGGEMLEWGAKTIPEGGYHALPERRTGDGVLIVGDSAGFVDVPSLKGIHYAVQSGIYAARAIFAALQRGDSDAASAVSAASLAAYDQSVNDSYIRSDLYRTRNMRLAFRDGFYSGAMKAGLMTVTGGRFPGDGPAGEADAEVPRTVTDPESFTPDGTLTTSKLDAVFKSGNATRDSIPSHLLVGPDITPEVADFYVHMCPAGVYERDGDGLRVNPANCIDCKATDDLGPRWTPRERGSGARYRLM